MEMRLTLTDADNAAAAHVAVASGHTSKRRAILEVFRKHHKRHLTELKRPKSRKP